jgi:hypothetical protein
VAIQTTSTSFRDGGAFSKALSASASASCVTSSTESSGTFSATMAEYTRRMSGWLMNARKSSRVTVVRFTRARYSARLVGAVNSLAGSRASPGGW